MPEQPKKKQAWIVTTQIKPPADWGFKPNWWHDHYYRVVVSKLHAVQLLADLNRLELDKPAKAKPFKFHLTP